MTDELESTAVAKADSGEVPKIAGDDPPQSEILGQDDDGSINHAGLSLQA